VQAIALVAFVEVIRDLLRPRRRELAIEVRQVVFQELLTRHATAGVGLSSLPRRQTRGSPAQGRPCYRSEGSMISAKAFRALFSRDFTVPRLQCVISAISSYERPSSSRRTNTSR
jgi:hypothetical protein